MSEPTLLAFAAWAGQLATRVAALEQGAGGGGLSAEAVQDLVAEMFPGASYDDPSGTITLPEGGSLDAEQVRAIVAQFAVAGANVTLTHDNAANTLTISAAGGGGAGGGTVSALSTVSGSRVFSVGASEIGGFPSWALPLRATLNAASGAVVYGLGVEGVFSNAQNAEMTVTVTRVSSGEVVAQRTRTAGQGLTAPLVLFSQPFTMLPGEEYRALLEVSGNGVSITPTTTRSSPYPVALDGINVTTGGTGAGASWAWGLALDLGTIEKNVVGTLEANDLPGWEGAAVGTVPVRTAGGVEWKVPVPVATFDKAYNTGLINPTAGGWFKVLLDAVPSGNAFVGSTFTAPAAGLYLITASIVMDQLQVGDNINLALFLNASFSGGSYQSGTGILSVHEGTQGAAGVGAWAGATTLMLSAGDRVEMWINSSGGRRILGGVAGSGPGQTQMAVTRLG